ncbi:hypothetical protein QWY84_08575 [Aquisalimonas lutea]|uniref:hypothetical protein n=1 Tax=Aquisalimonas lutea TaxID=1327750 RepID=UPI0025B5CB90|nr:hypothetical protein [Aquisalimonas lutea]MDN3517661.1 hypothetical protein [Aquisalimonas lutea]
MMESLHKVIDSEFRLAVLETHEPDRVVEAFKRLTLTTGRAVYGWSPNDGLYRLGTERIFIPHTRSFTDALGYIAASRHYGIYLVRDFQNALDKPSVQRALQRILAKDDDVRRLVLMLGSDVTIPEELRGQLARIRHNTARRANGDS